MIRIAEPLPGDEGPYESRGRFAADAMFTGTEKRVRTIK
jgi:hypothetical protein